MSFTPAALLAFLADHGIAAVTHHHPPLHTVAESQALRGDLPGAHTKNLFLRDSKKTYFLVTLEENTPVDLKALRSKIGARGGLSFGSTEALYEKLGVLPGSVTLLATINDPDHQVIVAVEARLLAADLVNCHPLTNEKTTALTPDALLRFLELTGHAPLRISLDADAPPVD
ncbi:prolyl-tRNA synthetase associated domain-containing protein [Aquabacter spiritensis]|uniref:Ala-tRNA(Pro) hydrolase n=1 Tax=Aquabacter spiritensis TaxID=933073 RepID=A0A4R3M720_9HYPH|nr:prolyl-tRNA synthetase associated domain-containing protein [Aquabacter spiritensis]TCT08059.1 Ala-tRNA(Pro) hydrolase [Aquabacter spiritensis]